MCQRPPHLASVHHQDTTVTYCRTKMPRTSPCIKYKEWAIYRSACAASLVNQGCDICWPRSWEGKQEETHEKEDCPCPVETAPKNSVVSVGCVAHRVCLLRHATSVLAYETAPLAAVGDGSTQKGDGAPAPYHSLDPGRSL